MWCNMDEMSNPAKERILSLLKFLSDIRVCQVEKGTMSIIAGHIVYSPTGRITEEHKQLLSEVEGLGVLTASDDVYTLNGGQIPEGTVSMSGDDVLGLLLKSIGISGLIETNTASGPNKDILPVMWGFLFDFAERHRHGSGS